MSEAILYQMKATDENHGKIFQGLKDDLEIDMNDYEEVARINLKEFKKVFKSDIQGMLESIFSYGNSTKQFRQNYPNARSISVSDIIEIDGKYYYCDTFGFKEVTDKMKIKQEESVEEYMDKLSVSYMAKIFNQMRQNGWDGKKETADQYFDDIMRKIDPNFKEDEPEEQVQAQDDSEPLREERYYYSEIVYVEDGLKSLLRSFEDVKSRIEQAKIEKEDNEYSDDQFQLLVNSQAVLTEVANKVMIIEEKLEKSFPSRIRAMTPEEKEYIEKHKNEIKEESKEIKTENVMYWVETIGFNPYDVNYEKNPQALEIIEKFKKAGKLDSLFDYFAAGLVDPFNTEEDYLDYVADTDISDFEIYNGKLDESKKLQEESDEENISINDLGDTSDPENKFHNEDGSEKTIYDYLEDRIGEDISVGELNTFLQSLFGKFGQTFLTFDEFYNQDPEESQELVVWDDEDMYTITYTIKDQIEPTIEITDVNVE